MNVLRTHIYTHTKKVLSFVGNVKCVLLQKSQFHNEEIKAK